MGESNYEDFTIAFADNDRVGKTSEYQSLHPASSGCAGHGYQRNDIFFERVEGCIDRVLELCAKPGTFFFVPRCGLGGFFGGRIA